MIKLSILRWGGYAGLSGGTNVITSVSRDPVREGVSKQKAVWHSFEPGKKVASRSFEGQRNDSPRASRKNAALLAP